MARSSLLVRTALACLCLAAATVSYAEALSPERLASARLFLERLERLGFAGVVAIAEEGLPVLVEGYGLADRERGIPWNPATVSTIGSITKQFTGAAILLLQEQGKLSVEDPISRYFEEVPEDKRSITLHHLLTHSSGIVDLDGVGDFDPIGRDEFVRRALLQELAFPPGERYEYSNAGYSLLGAIIEQTTGRSYEAFLRSSLLAPAGLYETGYLLPLWGEGRGAQGYASDGPWGTVLEKPFAEDGPYWVLRANGGIHSTAYDMLRWAKALMDGDLLSESSTQAYWQPHVSEGGDSSYGYGWSIMSFGEQKVVSHNGGNGIFFADMAFLPETGYVIFLQTNIAAEMPWAEQLMAALSYHLLAGEPLPRIPAVEEVPPAELAALEGKYQVAPNAGVAVDAGAQKVVVTPTDPLAFAYLHSNRVVDLQRSERLSKRIDAIVKASLAGNFEPLWEAYRGEVTLERLTMVRQDRMRSREERFGPFDRHEVLGTALRAEREITLVRLHFQNGFVDRAYVWAKDEEEKLLGTSRRGLGESMTFYPEGEGRFASWDPRTGESSPMRVVTDEEGQLRLSIGEGDLRIEALPR